MEYTESSFERGKLHYTLSKDSLAVDGKGGHVTLQLKGLEPDYEIVRHRSPGLYVGLLGAAIALVLSLCAIAGLLGAELTRDSYVLAVIIAAISLICLFTSWRNIERAIFRSTMGPVSIEIARAGPDSSSFHRFVEELSRRIQDAKESDGSPIR